MFPTGLFAFWGDVMKIYEIELCCMGDGEDDDNLALIQNNQAISLSIEQLPLFIEFVQRYYDIHVNKTGEIGNGKTDQTGN